MDVLGHIKRQVEYTKSNDILPVPECSERMYYRTIDTADFNFDPKTRLAVHNLLLRPWFDLLWVLQETQLANSFAVFHCGSDIME
jgi:hypothetical protein